MNHRIIIGIDEEDARIPAVHTCLWLSADISQSDTFYRLHNSVIPIDLYVFKDSKQGEDIKDWIAVEANRNNKSVEKKALELLLPRITPEDLVYRIEAEKRSSWERGYHQAQYDIRKAMGVL